MFPFLWGEGGSGEPRDTADADNDRRIPRRPRVKPREPRFPGLLCPARNYSFMTAFRASRRATRQGFIPRCFCGRPADARKVIYSAQKTGPREFMLRPVKRRCCGERCCCFEFRDASPLPRRNHGKLRFKWKFRDSLVLFISPIDPLNLLSPPLLLASISTTSLDASVFGGWE